MVPCTIHPELLAEQYRQQCEKQKEQIDKLRKQVSKMKTQISDKDKTIAKHKALYKELRTLRDKNKTHENLKL